MNGSGCSIFKAIEIGVMAHSLTVTSAAAVTATTAISGRGRSGNGKSDRKWSNFYSLFPIPIVWAAAGRHNHQASPSDEAIPHQHSVSLHRRALTVGLSIISGAVLLDLSWGEESQNAFAAARRPPPPPAEEKKDPNVSGVQAKVLASKKRKEALKQTVAKLREKADLIKQPPQ